MNWEHAVRPDRPFERFLRRNPAHASTYVIPSPAVRSAVQIPTAYYLEQAPFYVDNHGPDPFAAEAEALTPTPLQALVLTVPNLFSAFTRSLFTSLFAIITTFIASFRALGNWGMVYPLRMILAAVSSIEWAYFGVVVLAVQLVWLLPEWNGVVLEQREVAEPVYRILVSGGREAFGTGPVSAREF